MSNGHSRWQCMRVDDHIWSNTIFSKWHIGLWYNHTDGSFLSSTRCEFITHGWYTFMANTHFCNSLSFFTLCHKHLVYISHLTFFRQYGCVSQIPLIIYCFSLTNQYHFIMNFRIFLNQSIVI